MLAAVAEDDGLSLSNGLTGDDDADGMGCRTPDAGPSAAVPAMIGTRKTGSPNRHHHQPFELICSVELSAAAVDTARAPQRSVPTCGGSPAAGRHESQLQPRDAAAAAGDVAREHFPTPACPSIDLVDTQRLDGTGETRAHAHIHTQTYKRERRLASRGIRAKGYTSSSSSQGV